MVSYPPNWGHLYWDAMTFAVYAFPADPSEATATEMSTWLRTTAKVLPCPGCRLHAGAYMAQHAPDVRSGPHLRVWLVDFHNAVNARTGKRVYSYEEADADFHRRYLARTEISDLARSQAVRREDAITIASLRRELRTSAICTHAVYILILAVVAIAAMRRLRR